MRRLKVLTGWTTAILVVIAVLAFLNPWPLDVEGRFGFNPVIAHAPYRISDEAAQLHQQLRVADWHADTLLWSRDPLQESTVGHVDIPRLDQGNVAVQVFTVVTRVPLTGTQLTDNHNLGDRIAFLAMADGWPLAAKTSLYQRAVYQAQKLHQAQARMPDRVSIVRNQQELASTLAAQANGQPLLAALLGTEGLHPLEGELANIKKLYDHGYRVMGLLHFFDNELGGSLHGRTGQGLSAFGQQVVTELNQRNMIIDVAHASTAVVEDVLALSTKPVIVSHTGLRGACDSPRNIPDALMKRIVAKGGMIGIGYWEAAICDTSPGGIADHIRYAIDLLGVEHISLGSDFDGTVTTGLDTSELAALTQAMLDRNFTEQEIRAVMGENLIRFLSEQLPAL